MGLLIPPVLACHRPQLIEQEQDFRMFGVALTICVGTTVKGLKLNTTASNGFIWEAKGDIFLPLLGI